MFCPKCDSKQLLPDQIKEGLEIDHCPECLGIWLDSGELYAFVEDPIRVRSLLEAAYQQTLPTGFNCPRCNKPMAQAVLANNQLPFEACSDCAGTWFDAGEIQKLNLWLADPEAVLEPSVADAPPEVSKTLDDWERASVLGDDGRISYAFTFTAMGATALVLIFDPLRNPAGILGAIASNFAFWFLFLSLPRWYLGGAELISATILSSISTDDGEKELTVEFLFEEESVIVRRRVERQSPLDHPEGAAVQVLLNSIYPKGAYLVAFEHHDKNEEPPPPWLEEERDRRLSPKSFFHRGSLSEGASIPEPIVRTIGFAILLFGVEELMIGEAFEYLTANQHTGLLRLFEPMRSIEIPFLGTKIHAAIITLFGAWFTLGPQSD